MALRIVDNCVGCSACAPLCPHGAIRAAARHYVIERARCNECNGDYDEAQCAAICPIEGAIVDASGAALNPPGSLTGIDPQRIGTRMTPVTAERALP